MHKTGIGLLNKIAIIFYYQNLNVNGNFRKADSPKNPDSPRKSPLEFAIAESFPAYTTPI